MGEGSTKDKSSEVVRGGPTRARRSPVQAVRSEAVRFKAVQNSPRESKVVQGGSIDPTWPKIVRSGPRRLKGVQGGSKWSEMVRSDTAALSVPIHSHFYIAPVPLPGMCGEKL